MMEEDPIAQKHLAKLSNFQGEYDKWGNRLTHSMLNTRHLLEGPEQYQPRKSRRRKKKLIEHNENETMEHYDQTEFNFSTIYLSQTIIHPCFLAHPADLTLSPPPRFRVKETTASPDYQEKVTVKLSYRERYELEHTYTAHQGERLYKTDIRR